MQENKQKEADQANGPLAQMVINLDGGTLLCAFAFTGPNVFVALDMARRAVDEFEMRCKTAILESQRPKVLTPDLLASAMAGRS